MSNNNYGYGYQQQPQQQQQQPGQPQQQQPPVSQPGVPQMPALPGQQAGGGYQQPGISGYAQMAQAAPSVPMPNGIVSAGSSGYSQQPIPAAPMAAPYPAASTISTPPMAPQPAQQQPGYPPPSQQQQQPGYPQQQQLGQINYPTAAGPSTMQHPRMPSASQPGMAPPHAMGPAYGTGPSHGTGNAHGMAYGMAPARHHSVPVPVTGQPAPIGEIQQIPQAAPNVFPPNATKFNRCTLTRIPKSPAVSSKTKLSIGLSVTPFPMGVEEVPVAPASSPILRCTRCRTYLNPYAELIDSGARWKCNLCYLINDFPTTYDYDPQTQHKFDRAAKVELHSPVYEFIAPQEYMVRPPQAPAYVFLLDATYAAISSGMMATAVRTILESLDQIPDTEKRTRIGFMTFDGGLHFYSFNGGASEPPKMLVVADCLGDDAPFLPSDERDLLVPLSEYRPAIEEFLGSLAGYFANTQATSSALGPALSAAIKLLSNNGGKVVLVQASPATLGEGALKPRDDPRLYGTSQESPLLRPQSNFYKVQATECSRVQICIDMFLCPAAPMDLATLGTAARYTGGKVFLYQGFNAASQPEDACKLSSDLGSLLSREVSFESVIRIRASQGLSVNSYYGNFFLRSSDLLALPNINPDHSYAAQIILEDNLTSPVVCFQTAVLHTTCHGERRIRVINAAYPVTEIPEEVFDGADVGATVDLLAKMALEKIVNGSLEEARDALTNKLVEVSKAVHALYKLGSGAQLMVPESIRLLPLLLCALLRSPALRGGNGTPADLRSYYVLLVRTLSIPVLLDLIYPFFFAVNTLEPTAGLPDPETGDIVMPARFPLSVERVEKHGLYVLDNGNSVTMFVGSQIHPELCKLIFGCQFSDLETGKYSLPQLDNPWSQRLNNIMSKRRSMQAYQPSITLIKDDEQSGAQLKLAFMNQLIEDRTMENQLSYVQWINTIREKRKTGEDGKEASKEAEAKSTVEAAPKVPAATKSEAVPTHSGPVKSIDFAELCKVFEQIESTTKRLEIAEYLKTFFVHLMKDSPDDLCKVVYLSLSRLGPTYEGLELGLGEALLIKTIATSTGRTAAKIKKEIEELGDIGLVAETSRSNQSMMMKPKALNLDKVFKTLKEVATASGQNATGKKIEKVTSLFVACVGHEAKFLFRLLEGKLRIGLAEQTLLAALAQASAEFHGEAFNEPNEPVSIIKSVYSSMPNYDVIIPELLKNGVTSLPEACHLTPGIPLKPMLAYPTRSITEVLDRFEGMPFTCEYKYDGERAQIHRLKDGRTFIYSRNSENMSQKYPDLIEGIDRIAKPGTTSYVIDCEVVAWNPAEQKLLPFQILSTRKRKDVTMENINVQVCLFAFDILYLNGESLIELSFADRRKALQSAFQEVPGELYFAKHNDGSSVEDIQAFLEDSIQHGCEGLMVKTLEKDSTYEPSRRSRKWLKVKKDYLEGCGDSLDLVVIGGYLGRGKRKGVYGGYLLACYDPDNEEYQAICKIGTGFSDADLESQMTFFKDHVIPVARPYYRCTETVKPDVWFEPVQVWEVKAADFSISPVYSAGWGHIDPNKGISLRFPRFLRIRDDKSPEDATSSEQVAELYRLQALATGNDGGQQDYEEDY